MLPIADRNPTHRAAVLTFLLIAINVGVYFLTPFDNPAPALEGETQSGICSTAAFYQRWGAIPQEMTTGDQLERVVVGSVPEGCVTAPPPYEKQPALSVLSSMFLHAGLLHLLGNMLFLWIFGNNVEDRFGRLRFLLFYVGCGYVAAYAFALSFPDSSTPLVGASGAVAGVLGAYLVLYPRARVTTLITIIPVRLPAWIVLGAWFALQWYYSYGGGAHLQSDVAYVAHLYGFVAGVLVAVAVRVIAPRPPAPRLPAGDAPYLPGYGNVYDDARRRRDPWRRRRPPYDL